MKISYLIAAGLVGTILGVPLVAGRLQQAESRQPSFRSGVNLVLVDMRVAAGANAIRDLRMDEITLLVDGAPRPIVSLDYFPSDVQPQATNPGSPAPAGEALSNPGGRTRIRRVVIVVDRDSIESGEARSVEKNARVFIERLPPSFAVAVTPLPLRNGIRFEPKREDAQRALRETFAGTIRRGPGMEGMSGFGCSGSAASDGCGDQGLDPRIDEKRARDMNLAAELRIRGGAILDDLLWLFRSLDDGPSDVVIVTGGFPDEARLRPQIDKVLAAARAVNVHVHSIQVADLTQVPLREGRNAPEADAEPVPLLAARTPEPHRRSYGLPEETGGLEEDGSVTGEGFFNRLSGELAGAYVLAFEPLASERDGKPHRIEIRLPQRKRATVRARKVFVLPSSTRPGVMTAVPSVSPADVPLATALPPIVEIAPSLAATPPRGSEGVAILRALIERASEYVDDVERFLPSVVLEEHYVQVVKRWTGAGPSKGEEPELEWRSAPAERSDSPSRILRRRQLLSDVLLVQTPGKAWAGYRDVAEVDGKAVRDRADRVQRLFMSRRSDARRQLQRIADESARLNLGARRNINTPTFPLWLLLAQNVGRFEWTLEGNTSGTGCCSVVGFREVATPTIVRTTERRDVRLGGRFWIEPDTGRIWHAALHFKEAGASVEGAFDVRYGPIDDLDVLVPIDLWEWSRTPDPDAALRTAYVEGRASYANIRRFTVRAEESIK